MTKATDEQIIESFNSLKSPSKIAGALGISPKSRSWKSGWRVIGSVNKFYRSRWEANYARYLEMLKQRLEIKEWFHEPQTFWFESIKRGSRSYLPDFKIIKTDGTHYWVEVKGYMDSRSKTKIKRFHKYYSNEKLYIVDRKWFLDNFKTISCQILDWEFGREF